MQGKLMKRMIVLLAVIMILAGCGNSKKAEIDYSPTYVAQTIEAWERPIAQPQTETAPDPTPTILPTSTPKPTKETSVLNKIADSLEFGYCPETKTRNAIAELRALTDLEDTDNQTNETETKDSANWTLSLFDNEEDRTIAVERMKILIADIEAVPVPECLRYPKSLYVKVMSDANLIAESYSFENNDGSWFGELLKLTMINDLADEEIIKIEQCLPNCEKP
jgi:hypothetical protein